MIRTHYSTDTSIGIPFQVLVWVSDSIRRVATSVTYYLPAICEYFRYLSQFEQNVETARAPSKDGPITVNTSHCIYPSPDIPYFRRGYPRTSLSSKAPRSTCGSWNSSGLNNRYRTLQSVYQEQRTCDGILTCSLPSNTMSVFRHNWPVQMAHVS